MSQLESTVSMYAPVVGGMSFVSSGSIAGGSIAMRTYISMKSVRTILTPIEYRLEHHDDFIDLGPIDLAVLAQLREFIHNILNCNLKDLFNLVDDCLNETRIILTQEGLSQIVEKWASTLLGSLFSMSQIESSLIFEAAQQRTHDECCLVEHHPSVSDLNSDELVVCRICDEHVPAELFEQHSESCIAAYQSEAKLNEVNQEIKNLMNDIETTFLDVDWPGIRTTMIDETIPILQVYLLLKRSFDTDALSTDASDDLATIQKALIYTNPIQAVNPFIKSGAYLVREKRRQSIALTNAASVLRQTRISGSDQIVSQTNVSIAEFVFLKRISAGAYARVFLGQKKKTGDLYAIKVLPKNEMKQKNQVKRVLAERDILMQFLNPFIVNFLMEFLPGGDLYSLLETLGSLDEDSAKLYTMEILEALRYLRDNGIIHRDIKPDNILVSQTGALKLTDFGLSHLGAFDRQAVISDPSLASASSFVGTPDYTAPEIILNKPHSFTADYWSLGVMLYEFLMGQPPFHGESEQETHTNILKTAVNYSNMEEEGFSMEVIDLLKKLLVIEPSKRLGAESIEEIISHPWFDGVNTSTDTPPFIPELNTSADTEYFQQRYTFKNEDDSDIIEDIAELNPDYQKEISSEMNKFQAVAVDQLKEKNTKVAENLRRMSKIGVQKNQSLNLSDLTLDSLLSPPSSFGSDPLTPAGDGGKLKKNLKSNSFSSLNVQSLLSSSSFLNDKDDNSSPLLFQLNNNNNNNNNGGCLWPHNGFDDDDDDFGDDDDDGINAFPKIEIDPQQTLQKQAKKVVLPTSSSKIKLGVMKSNSSTQLNIYDLAKLRQSDSFGHNSANLRSVTMCNNSSTNLLNNVADNIHNRKGRNNASTDRIIDDKRVEKAFSLKFGQQQPIPSHLNESGEFGNVNFSPKKADHELIRRKSAEDDLQRLKPSDITIDLILSSTPEDLGFGHQEHKAAELISDDENEN